MDKKLLLAVLVASTHLVLVLVPSHGYVFRSSFQRRTANGTLQRRPLNVFSNDPSLGAEDMVRIDLGHRFHQQPQPQVQAHHPRQPQVSSAGSKYMEISLVNPRDVLHVDTDALLPPQEAPGELDGPVADERFLNVFTVVRFKNNGCRASSGSESAFRGVCYHQAECEELHGTAMGVCAHGYGVCCVFQYSCGDHTNRNISYFECGKFDGSDPHDHAATTTTTTSTTTKKPYHHHHHHWADVDPVIDPRLNNSQKIVTPGWRSCSFTIYKSAPDVRQVRIDFQDLDLRPPADGDCTEDKLIISGQNVNSRIPELCGCNTGQHVYADVSGAKGPLLLELLSRSAKKRHCRLKVTQIRSGCPLNNCLQYYNGLDGVIASFNYEGKKPGYLNSLNYAVCIRREPGYCSVTYTNVQDHQEFPFQLVNKDEDGRNVLPAGQAGAGIFNCPDDYVTINGVRLCGDRLNDGAMLEDFTRSAPVTDLTAGPIVLQVHTGHASVGRGFKLFYRQLRCAT